MNPPPVPRRHPRARPPPAASGHFHARAQLSGIQCLPRCTLCPGGMLSRWAGCGTLFLTVLSLLVPARVGSVSDNVPSAAARCPLLAAAGCTVWMPRMASVHGCQPSVLIRAERCAMWANWLGRRRVAWAAPVAASGCRGLPPQSRANRCGASGAQCTREYVNTDDGRLWVRVLQWAGLVPAAGASSRG